MRSGRGKFRQNPFEYSGILCCLRCMKKNLLWLAGAVMASLAFTSCYYDPYYGGGSTSVGGSYSSGYGDGYGYGGSSFNTSVFVSTGNPRWGYDPNCYSYYDYSSRRYYDPYLNGYYPIGYRPPVVYGVPHPYGYRRGYCPPPSRIHGGYVSNYRNREYAYRNSSYGWAKQVRQQSPGAGRPQGSRPAQSQYDRQGQGRPNNASRPGNSYSRDSQRNPQRESSRPSGRQQQNNARQPSRNNTLVNSQQGQRGSRPSAGNPQRQQAQRQQAQRNAGNQQRQQAQRQQGQRQPQQGGGGQRKAQGEKEGKRMQGYR